MKGLDSTTALLAMAAADDEYEFAVARLAAIEASGLAGPLPGLDAAACAGMGAAPALGVALVLGCPVRTGADGEVEHEPHGPSTVAARIGTVTRRRPAQVDVPWTQPPTNPATTRTAGGGRTGVHCQVCGPLQLEISGARAEAAASRHNSAHRQSAASAAAGAR